MNKRLIVVLVCCLLVCGSAYARRIAWKKTDKPPVSLHLAITLAESELEKEPTKYFCIGAFLARTFSEGDWELRFSSEDGKEMRVSVGSDKSVRKSKEGFEY